ncbi:MAG TPA: hypothetical protein VJR58_22475 [Vineibacter sp.]|nr:hypothetical protein [Vineibacter sp.]
MSHYHEIPETLLNLIYDAATDDKLWPSVLRTIADLTASGNGILICQSAKRQAVFFEYHYGTDDACLRALGERHIVNPWSDYLGRRHTSGIVVPSERVLSLAELSRTAFYDEVLRPQNTSHGALLGLVDTADFAVACVTGRDDRRGPYDEAALGFFSRLAPHLTRAVQLGHRVNAYRAMQRLEYRTLDHLAIGVVLLDRRARVLFANAAARALDGAGGPLQLRHGRVGHVSAVHSRRLDNLVQSLLHGTPMAAISLPHLEEGYPLTVLAAAMRGNDLDRFSDAHLKDAAVILFIFDPASRRGIPTAWLTEAYGLTHAEASVAIASATCGTVAGTAEHLGVSPNTVKTHLRRVFTKTSITRQADLAGLIASLRVVRSD